MGALEGARAGARPPEVAPGVRFGVERDEEGRIIAYTVHFSAEYVEEEEDEAAAEAPTGARDRPGLDAGGDEEALDQVCAMRARSARRWAVTIEELEEQSAGATDTDCEDPVMDPAAADAEKAVPKCGPSRERESPTEQIMTLLGAYRDRQCGPTERPGPDGECRGGRNLPDGTGRLWYGYGDVIGLVPCEGTACDPAENP